MVPENLLESLKSKNMNTGTQNTTSFMDLEFTFKSTHLYVFFC